MTTREIIDAISALLEVIKANDTPLGSKEAIDAANLKIIALIKYLQ